MQVTSVTDPNSQSLSTSTQSTSALEQDAFLQLFVAQLKYQDPSSPMDTSSMLNQMAQLSIIEQITKISTGITQIKLSQEIGEASTLLGKQVTVQTKDGTISGQVEKAALCDEEVKIFIDGTGYGLEQVTEFELG